MAIELKMPALSPTMEEGTLAKWLVKEGDTVSSGDILAEIETDKATMEFEAVDEGVVTKILVAEGTDGVKVGTPIALIGGEGEEAAPAPAPAAAGRGRPSPRRLPRPKPPRPRRPPRRRSRPRPRPRSPPPRPRPTATRVKASPLARKLAEAQGIDLATLQGSGPGGRIVRADLGKARRRCRCRPAAGPGRRARRCCACRRRCAGAAVQHRHSA